MGCQGASCLGEYNFSMFQQKLTTFDDPLRPAGFKKSRALHNLAVLPALQVAQTREEEAGSSWEHTRTGSYSLQLKAGGTAPCLLDFANSGSSKSFLISHRYG